MATPAIVRIINTTSLKNSVNFLAEAGLGRRSENVNFIGADVSGNMYTLKLNGDTAARLEGDLTCLKWSNAIDAGGECIRPTTGNFRSLVGAWAGGVAASNSTTDNPYQWVQWFGDDVINVTAGLAHGADPTDLSSYMIPANAADSAAAAAAVAADLSDLHDWRVARNLSSIGAGATTASVWWGLTAL
jgi:hypothetical protein